MGFSCKRYISVTGYILMLPTVEEGKAACSVSHKANNTWHDSFIKKSQTS